MKIIREFFTGLRKKLAGWMNRTPLWVEFTLLLSLFMLLLTIVLSISIHSHERKQLLNSTAAESERLLKLRMENMENYADELSAFSILPVYDASLYSLLLSRGSLNSASIEEIRSAARSFYYSRNDLLSYHIYIPGQAIAIGNPGSGKGFRVYDTENIEDMEIYRLCLENPRGYAIVPSENDDALFDFAHSIINIADKSIIAITRLEADLSVAEKLNSQKISEGEIICLYAPDDRLLYSSNGEDIPMPSKQSTDLNGESYICTEIKGERTGMTLISLLPEKEINAIINKSLGFAIITGLLFMLIAVVFAYVLIRYLSAPLSTLARMQLEFGKGSYKKTVIGRSRESTVLSASFNQMTEEIGQLIEKNYVSRLNEKTAVLSALEAQINPHFLYNTLQAIGSEALLNDQKRIYDMLTSLASNLRYSINSSNTVKLRDELVYTDNYIMLQKLRLGERLEVVKDIDDAALDAEIPKVSIQALADNSITHGMSGDHTSIRISVSIKLLRERLMIRVWDNGCGIPSDRLSEINEKLGDETLSSGENIGLANLYNRLKLIYADKADMTIDTAVGRDSFTEITITLPAAGGN